MAVSTVGGAGHARAGEIPSTALGSLSPGAARTTVEPVLIGRESECARLDELLDNARLGRSGALVVRGEAGIGKTALLEYARERAEGMSVVHTVGVESEIELEFSALLDVCRPLLGHVSEITERQAMALRAALGVSPADSLDRFAIGAATLGLLAAAAEASPLVVLVDDAQWVDASSAETLLFATRRLDADRVVVLYAAREEDGRFEAPGLESISLEGLSWEAASHVLHGQVEIAPAVADRLYDATGGNPLALLELPSVLSPEQLGGVVPLDEPLPAGSSVERAFGRRAEALSEDARVALLLAAVSWSRSLDTILPALDLRGLGPGSLEEAEDAGLVKLVDGTLAFRHPLVRSAVYQAAAPSERRAAHRALARACGGKVSDEGAWHLAAAAIGPDEEVAEALAEVAERARARNAHAEAAAALERAARLSPVPSFRVERFIEAAEAAWVVADPGRTLGLIDAAQDGPAGPAERARMLSLRGAVEGRVGQLSVARDLFLEAEALVVEESRSDAAAFVRAAASVTFFAGDLPAAVALARRQRDLAPRDDSELDGRADTMLGWLLFLSGNADEGTQFLERAVDLLLTPSEPSLLELHNAGVALSLLERTAAGDDVLARALRLARQEGAPRAVLSGLAQLTLFDVQAGRWQLALAHGEEGLALAGQLGHMDQHASIAIELARIDAARGAEVRCRERVNESVRLAGEHGIVTARVAAEIVLGELELSLGRSAEAIEQLQGSAAEVERLGIHDRYTSPHPSLVEALVRSGRRDESADVLARYAAIAQGGTPLWGGALLARGNGMLAEDHDEADEHFGEALRLHALVEDRFQHARTLLAFGERLRRGGRRLEARSRLRGALELFQELEARPWTERTEQELRASGERLRRRESFEAEQLTPQELQIALQVAEGKTNKEVGAALFLSHKTVEFHLSRIYRKLDLNSRAELIRRFAAEGAPV
jgi:DNA-binding CsgD family transcriptional regulator